MDIAVTKLASFSPPLHRVNKRDYIGENIETQKLSPSDIPNEIEVFSKNSIFKIKFDYRINEDNLKLISSTEWELAFSEVTGRIYQAEFNSKSFSQVIDKIFSIRKNFLKDRLNDNMKLGEELISAVIDYIKHTENKE